MRLVLGLLVTAAIFVPLEKWFALRKQRILRDGWRTDVCHFLFSHLLVLLGLVLAVGISLPLLDRLVSPRLQQAVAAQSGWLQFAEALLVAELMGYLGHFLAHRVSWLWRFHSVHHGSRSMDWLAAARVHPIDQIFTRTLQFVPLYLLGFSAATFGAYAGFVTVWAIFRHANVRFRFGPLRYLVSTPEFHHWHHADEPEALNKNFAGQFPWVDALFGTLHLPPRPPSRYGCDAPMQEGYLRQLALPFRSRR